MLGSWDSGKNEYSGFTVLLTDSDIFSECHNQNNNKNKESDVGDKNNELTISVVAIISLLNKLK